MTLICPSAVDAVEVFARGAVVTRRVALPAVLPAGDVVLVLEGVTPLAAPGSLRASLAGADSGRRVRAVRSVLVVPAAGDPAGDDDVALAALDADIGRVQSELDVLASLAERLGGLSLEPQWSRKAPPAGPRAVGQRTAEALAADDMLAALGADLDARRAALLAEYDRLCRARDDRALAASQASSAARQGAGRTARRIEVELTGEGPVEGLVVRYAVPAARWWPRYVLRVEEGFKRALWTLEGLVAQRSGEDWASASLSLSTADLCFDARLPELPSLRLGRAQPPRKGFRAPPPGLDAMFAGYDKAFGAPPPPPRVEAAPEWQADAGEVASESLLREESAYEPEAPVPPPARRSMAAEGAPRLERARRAMPAPPAAMSMAPQTKSRGGLGAVLGAPVALVSAAMDARSAPGGGGGGGGADSEPLPVEPADAWLDYDALTLAGPEAGAQRGRLSRRNEPAVAESTRDAEAAIEALEGPVGARDPRDSRGRFDHAYPVPGSAEVPGDGQLHRVPLGEAECQPLVRWRTVPRAEPEVFREAELRNPFDAPLLAGPVEVFVDGSLLAVSDIDRIDRGGILRVGLGVERRIRVARNVRMTEETVGLLGGDTVLTHRVSITLTSALAAPALVDVIDRVPVSDDKGVALAALPARPEPEVYTQADRGQPARGVRAWKVIVPAGQSASIEFGYRVTLPSKSEIVGGNRRG